MQNLELALELGDLNLDELDVTTLRDTVALPETAASDRTSSCSGCCGSCGGHQPQLPGGPES